MPVIHRTKSGPEVFEVHHFTQEWRICCWTELPCLGNLRFQVPDSLKITVVSSSSCLMIFDSHFLQLSPPLKPIGHGWLCMPEGGGNQPPLPRPALEGTAVKTSLYTWEEGRPERQRHWPQSHCRYKRQDENPGLLIQSQYILGDTCYLPSKSKKKLQSHGLEIMITCQF